MDIYWFGQACFKLKGKNATIITDPFDPEFVGLKFPKDETADVVLISHSHQDHNFSKGIAGDPKIFSGPGEYEVQGVTVTGVASFHDKTQGKERGNNTIFHTLIDGLNVVHLGDFGQSSLTEEQIETIDTTDVLLIPVGGIFTIDGKEAAGIVAVLEPKIIVPMHFWLDGLKFELEGVDKFLKEMGAENVLAQPKLSITKEKLPEEPMVVVLSKA